MELESTLHLQQQIARLQALLEASHKIHSTIELDSVLRAVLELSVRELEMAGAFFTAFPFSDFNARKYTPFESTETSKEISGCGLLITD